MGAKAKAEGKETES